MDGENIGKHYFLMDDLGGKPIIFGNTHSPRGEVLEVQTENFTAPAAPKASKKKNSGFCTQMRAKWIRNRFCHTLGLTLMVYMYLGTQMTSIFEGQPPQNKAFSNQNKGHLGSREVNLLYMEGGDNSAYW